MEKQAVLKRIARAITVALVVMSVALFVPGIAGAFTMNLYETLENTPSGTACEICSILTLPALVQGGYVILFENASGSLTDATTWSDVVIFGTNSTAGILQGDNTSTAPYVQLLSDGCASGVDGDISCFPSVALVTSLPHATLVETAPPTVYSPLLNTYNIYSDTEATGVPEPGSLLLLGSGLVGLGLWGRNRFKGIKA